MATSNFMPADIQQALSNAASNLVTPNSPVTSVAPTPRTVAPTSQQNQISGSQTSSASQQQPTVVAVASIKSSAAHSPSQTSVVQAVTSSPQFIAVTVSEQEGSAASNQGSVSLQSTGSSVHPTYVQYVDGGGEHGLYPSPNGQMTGYSVYSVADSSTMYTPATSYYNNGTGPTTYSQVHLLEEGGVYKVQNELLDGESGHHTLTTTSARISPVSAAGEDHRKVSDIITHYSNEQCVIQTLHGSHEGQIQIATAQPQQASPQQQQQQQTQQQTQQQQTQQQSQQQSQQHLNVRDMDIIHVQWLIDNYETAEGVSLPRSTLYAHYLRHCTEHKLEPVNAASFGKLIRSVFLGLRTRRLGTRGNSKYHYYGIRVKPTSPLSQISEEMNNSQGGGALRQVISSNNKRSTTTATTKTTVVSKPDNQEGGSSSSSVSGSGGPEPLPSSQHQEFLGDPSNAVPSFHDILIIPSPHLISSDLSQDDFHAFRSLYRQQCEAFLDSIINLQFGMVETLWQTFWRMPGTNHAHNEYEKILSKPKLYMLCKCEAIQNFVRQADYQFYQNLVDVLIPDVLRPIPSSLTQAIRNFAKSLEGWLTSAMSGCPEEIVKIKLSAASAFSQTLRRYTSLNHLAQAARAVLQNSAQINQMLADLNRVDFHNVQEQASWVCQCEDGIVQRLEQDFKATLQQQTSLEQWAGWLEGVVSLVLRPHEPRASAADFPRAARQFLLRWSFYSSMVIRDLTLRSAASFGSFHLIRLLYDEYMFYLIEHCVAKATGATPIAVMAEFIGGQGGNNSLKSPSNSRTLVSLLSSESKHTLDSNGPIGGGEYLNNVNLTNGLKESLGLLDQSSLGNDEATNGNSPLHKKLKIV